MTKKEFEAKAVRDAEKRLEVPHGWWGTWKTIYGPHGERVTCSRGVWIIRCGKLLIGRSDSRASAIRRARASRSTLR